MLVFSLRNMFWAHFWLKSFQIISYSRGKWGNLVQTDVDNKKFQKLFYSNQFFYTHKSSNILESFYIPIYKINIQKKNLYLASLYFTFQISFSYNQITFFFHPLENFYIFHDHIGTSFLFLFQKDFYIALDHIGVFCLFLFKKDFGTFHELFLKAFLSLYPVNTLIYRKKNYKKYLISFFICFKN